MSDTVIEPPKFPEIDAMQAFIMTPLTPDEQVRALDYLNDRVRSDIKKGIVAAGMFADFVHAGMVAIEAEKKGVA